MLACQHESCCEVAACNSWWPAVPLLCSALVCPTSQNRALLKQVNRAVSHTVFHAAFINDP